MSLGAFAVETPNSISSYTSISTEASAQIYYDGPAYSAGSGLIPQADNSVRVLWTSEGCTVNGNPSANPGSVNGGFMMRVNGKTITMNYYVMCGGERYYFAI